MSKHTLVIDSSQISQYLECPREWQYSHVKQLVPNRVVLDDEVKALNAGSYGHKILDIYYKERASGLNLNDSYTKAVAYDADKDTCECGCSIDYHKYIPAFKIHECHRCKKCLNFKAKPYALDMETRQIVQSRLRQYFFNYQMNDFTVTDPNQVEVGFSEVIYEDSENLFVLEGRIDLLATLQNLDCVVDHKFQMSRYFLYNKTIQAKNYALVSKRLVFIYNYIRLAKTLDSFTLMRVITSFSVHELLAWKVKLIEIFFHIKASQLSNQYEQRWNACQGRYKTYELTKPRFCKFTDLCETSDPEMARRKESMLYQVNPNPWRPW